MSNLRISSFGAPKNSPPPASPSPPAPDHSADLAELAQWRAAFPNETPRRILDFFKSIHERISELEDELAVAKASTKPKAAPKKKKAKK